MTPPADPVPLTDTTTRRIWLDAIASETGIVIPIPDPTTCMLIRDRLNERRRELAAEEPRVNDYIIHVPEDLRSLTIKPRLANVLP